MSQLEWSVVGERYFETGVDRAVLYVGEAPGVAWSGVVSVVESPSGGEVKSYYLDGINYLNVASKGKFEATLSAFYSPREFDQCDGVDLVARGLYVSQQSRKPFGLSYRTKVGNDIQGVDYSYKIHIVYNALAAPAERSYNTLSAEPEVEPLSWKISTRARLIPGAAPSAHVIIDTSKAHHLAVEQIESILYGNDAEEARLPTPEEIVALFNTYPDLTFIDNGNGTFTATGPPDQVYMIDADRFEINASTVEPSGSAYAATSQ